MEMLKKIMIVLAITGSCAVQAAAGGSIEGDFYNEGAIKEIALVKYSNKCSNVTGTERYFVQTMDDPEGHWETVDLGRQEADRCRKVDANRMVYENVLRNAPIELAVQQIAGYITEPKGTGFASQVVTYKNGIYKNICKALFTQNYSQSAYPWLISSRGEHNRNLLFKNESARKNVKALLDEVGVLHTQINTLLAAPDGKNWKHQRSPENKRLISEKVNNLNRIDKKMEQIFSFLETETIKAREAAIREDYRVESARRAQISAQFQADTKSGYYEWCAAGNNPDSYW